MDLIFDPMLLPLSKKDYLPNWANYLSYAHEAKNLLSCGA